MNYEKLLQVDKNKGMVNLTKMAEGFNRKVNDWLRLKGTKEHLEAYARMASNTRSGNLIYVSNGKNMEHGSWADRKVAIRFAQWLNPDFAVWVDSKLDELFTTGRVEVTTIDPSQAQFWQNLQQQNQLAQTYLQNALSKEKEKTAKLESENVKLLTRDLEVKTQKEYKWVNQELQNDRGRTINYYVFLHFLQTDHAQAHRDAKQAYFEAAGIRLPHRIKLASSEQKKAYLDWLSRYESNKI